MLLLLDYLDVLDDSAAMLDGLRPGRVSDAFTQGVRIGLLHEKLLSLVDGRYQQKWLMDYGRQVAADKTNIKKAKERPDYAAAVKQLMETGVKYHPACESVAGEFGVVKKTVENHTRELTPGRNRKNA